MDRPFFEKLNDCGCAVIENAVMANFSFFKTGGKAKALILSKTMKSAEAAYLELLKSKQKFAILGNGSNTLISDNGYNGYILKYSGESEIKVNDNLLVCGGGVSGARVSAKALQCGLAGAEFMSSIPGSTAGLTRMNGGCYGSQMCDIIDSVEGYIEDKPFKFTNGQCGFSYRHSVFAEMDRYIILKVTIRLAQGDRQDILYRIKEIKEKRSSTQPVDRPSLGSVFKRQGEIIPAKLIDEAGLKGTIIGGAMVSTKHSGFIINYNYATSSDMVKLIEYIKDKIYLKYNVMLTEEIIYL